MYLFYENIQPIRVSLETSPRFVLPSPNCLEFCFLASNSKTSNCAIGKISLFTNRVSRKILRRWITRNAKNLISPKRKFRGHILKILIHPLISDPSNLYKFCFYCHATHVTSQVLQPKSEHRRYRGRHMFITLYCVFILTLFQPFNIFVFQ